MYCMTEVFTTFAYAVVTAYVPTTHLERYERYLRSDVKKRKEKMEHASTPSQYSDTTGVDSYGFPISVLNRNVVSLSFLGESS